MLVDLTNIQSRSTGVYHAHREQIVHPGMPSLHILRQRGSRLTQGKKWLGSLHAERQNQRVDPFTRPRSEPGNVDLRAAD